MTRFEWLELNSARQIIAKIANIIGDNKKEFIEEFIPDLEYVPDFDSFRVLFSANSVYILFDDEETAKEFTGSFSFQDVAEWVDCQ